MLVLVTMGAAVVVNKTPFVPASWSAGVESLAATAGLGIDEVSVTGHRFTSDSDIFECLDLGNVKTMTALDSARVKARIERLPWIASATISRVYPGRIDLAVTERSPFAVWLTDAGAHLVDETGRTLAMVATSYSPALPRLSGEGAPLAAKALFNMLAHVPDVHARLVKARRIADRRWSLELTNRLRIELPPEGEATTLADLIRNPGTPSLLDAHDTILDLRSRREIAVRPAGAG